MGPDRDVSRGDQKGALARLARARLVVAGSLTAAMCAVYFGFLLLVAYQKPLLATLAAPGLSLGVLFGVLVIVVAFVLTGVYVGWANRRYDPELERLARLARGAGDDGGDA